jgi:glycerol-3-phosphate acyltransferase PlsY
MRSILTILEAGPGLLRTNTESGAMLALAYLLGSIPFGYLIVKLSSGTDIREIGSGGTGATNVTRKAGKMAGIVTLALDALKGIAAVLLVGWLDPRLAPLAGLMAIVGHCFPVWLGFRAGKGVATGLGVFLVIVPWSVLVALVSFILIVWRTRYISLGSIVAALIVPATTIFQHLLVRPIPNFRLVIISLSLSSALIIAKHAENIKRLMAGTENKFGVAR